MIKSQLINKIFALPGEVDLVSQSIENTGKITFKSAYIFVCLFFLSLLVILKTEAQSTFPERANYIINRLRDENETNPKLAFWYAQAKFYNYQVNGNMVKLTEARKQVSQALDHFNAKDPSFQLWASKDCYLRWGNLYGEALKDKMVNSPDYGSHNTHNKELMAATGRFLASETWPEAAFASSYSPSPADPTGELTLLREMNEYMHVGEQEHNSYTYYALHYGSLRILGDLTKDPEMKNKGNLTAEWLLISAMDASGIRDERPRLNYTSLHDAVLETVYDPKDRRKNHDKVNNQAVNYEHWSLLENPWTKQEYNSHSLRVRYSKATRTCDFANWNVFSNIL